jgi:hypothetical protein
MRDRESAEKTKIKTEKVKTKKTGRKIIIRKKKDTIVIPPDRKKAVRKEKAPLKKPLTEEEIIDRVQSIPPL